MVTDDEFLSFDNIPVLDKTFSPQRKHINQNAKSESSTAADEACRHATKWKWVVYANMLKMCEFTVRNERNCLQISSAESYNVRENISRNRSLNGVVNFVVGVCFCDVLNSIFVFT